MVTNNKILKKQLLDALDELWYEIFEERPMYYDMVIKKKKKETKEEITVNDIKYKLQNYHIRTRHWIGFLDE